MADEFNPTDWDYPHRAGVIRVASGRYVDVLNPEPDMFQIVDIAHSLAVVARFGGHTARPWSVAEHSLNVASALERQFGDPLLALCGLLHDAAEAYIGDIVNPIKHEPDMVGYRSIERNIEIAIAKQFGLPETMPDEVKAADRFMLTAEMCMIRDAWWRQPTGSDAIRGAFIQEFHRLNGAWQAER